MSAVMIGIDPHKGPHAAVAVGAAEEPLGGLRVRAGAAQAGTLAAWAAPWPGGRGRWRAPTGLAACWPSSWPPPGERVLGVPCDELHFRGRVSWPPGWNAATVCLVLRVELAGQGRLLIPADE